MINTSVSVQGLPVGPMDGCWFSSDLFGVRVWVNESVGPGSRASEQSPPPIINVNYHAHISPARSIRAESSSSLCAVRVTHDFLNASELPQKTLSRSTTWQFLVNDLLKWSETPKKTHCPHKPGRSPKTHTLVYVNISWMEGTVS